MVSDSPESSDHSWAGSLKGRNVCILTFGCTYNEGDSARIRGILTGSGSQLVSSPQDADVVIVNSCIVIEKTERRMIRLLQDLGKMGREVWITGCLPAARESLLDAFPDVRVLLPGEVGRAPDHLLSSPCGPVAVVQTGSGCLGACRFCITRLARGRIHSIPREDILKEIERAVAGGAVEIRLTGQDLSAYGYDWGSPCLPDLLTCIGGLEGDFFVRLGMMNPATLAPVAGDVAKALQNDHFFSFVHLPAQSGADSVLSLMNRGYTAEQFFTLADQFRKIDPGMAIATDMIVGFPGEGDAEFRESVRFLSRLGPDMVNVTRYSYRPGSTASRTGEMPDRIKKDRSRELIRTAYQILKTRRQALIGKKVEIIITEKIRDGSVMGRNQTYTGVVVPESLPVGERCTVEITGNRIHYLLGRSVSRDD
jgi:tRNA A37 methylthiotransferase MiaB